MGTWWEPTRLEQASPGAAASYGSPWIIIPASDTRACSWEILTSALLGDGVSACRTGSQWEPLWYGPAACLHAPSAGCRWGRWKRSSEISRVCKTATQRQDVNGVVIQATFAWEYLMPKCLKIFSLKIVTNRLPLFLLVNRIFLFWLWPGLLVTWMEMMCVPLPLKLPLRRDVVDAGYSSDLHGTKLVGRDLS